MIKLLFFPVLLFISIIFASPTLAVTIPYNITTGIPEQPIIKGATFLAVDLDINYQSGQIIFSGNADGTGDTRVDDAAMVWVVERPDGTSASTTFRYDTRCAYISSKPPQDVTSLFKPGINKVQVKLYDICGGLSSSSSIYLVNTNAPDPIPPKTPIIFIPGIGGSELKTKDTVIWSQPDGHGGTYNHTYVGGEKVWDNEVEVLDPGNDDYFDILRIKGNGYTSEVNLELTGYLYSRFYQSAIDYFVANGYQLHKDLFIFPYDWRQDVSLTTPLLDQKIEAVKTQTGSQKVDIVAHSLGGLVARNYIADSTRALKVRKSIILGAPHLGSIKSVKQILFGDCLAFEIGPICPTLNPSETKDIVQNMISGYELAPSQKYYDFYDGSDSNHPLPFIDNRDIDNNSVTGSLNYQQLKTTLTNLGHNTALFTPSEEFHNLDNSLANTNGVDVSIIAGSGQATTGQIIEGYTLNFMGIKIPKTDIRKINGDDTVPLFSASLRDGTKSLSGSAKVYYVNQSHSSLVFNSPAMNLVKNILNDDIATPDGISLQPFSFKGNALSVHSPVLIHAYDQNGRHTGPLPNGDYETNIPGSSYEVLGDAKFIWLPDNGQYNLKFAATDQGSFDFKIKAYDNSENNKIIIYKNIPLTNQTKAETSFDTSASPPILQVDEDGNGTPDLQISPSGIVIGSAALDTTAPKTEIKLTGDQGTSGWYKSDVKVEFLASDEANGSGIAKTEYSLDNGQTVQTYDQPFNITVEGTTKIKYRSIDQVGNEEAPKEAEIKIDKTAPEAKISVDPDKEDLTVTGIDQNVTTITKKDNPETKKKDDAVYEITDLAGNITRLDVRERDQGKQDRFAIYSVKYNDGEIYKLPQNHFNVSYTGKRTRSNINEQNFELKGEVKIRIQYNQKKNQSTIIIKEPKQEKVKEIKSGLVFLQVLTNKGQLETQY